MYDFLKDFSLNLKKTTKPNDSLYSKNIYNAIENRPKKTWLKAVKDMPQEDVLLLSGYRDIAVQEYAWAIPNLKALKAIKKYSPIIELGAGSGYWAYELNKIKTQIKAFDNFSWKEEFIKSWYPVKKGTPSIIQKYPNRTLLLIWPPQKDNFAINCLKYYKGNTLIYVGEDHGGCTANDAFFENLNTNWELKKIINIPQWLWIKDYLFIYKRKEVSSQWQKKTSNRKAFKKANI